MPPVMRMPSMWLVDSTWITSAPSSGEQAGGRRPGPPGGEVEHLQAGERQGARRAGGTVGAGRGASVPLAGDEPRAGAGRGAGGAWPSTSHGRRGARNVLVGVVDEHATSVDVVDLEHGLAVGHRGDRDAQLGGAAHDLVGRVLRREGVDHLVPLVPPAHAGAEAGPRRVLQQVGPFDEEQNDSYWLRVFVLKPT